MDEAEKREIMRRAREICNVDLAKHFKYINDVRAERAAQLAAEQQAKRTEQLLRRRMAPDGIVRKMAPDYARSPRNTGSIEDVLARTSTKNSIRCD
jgi:hypothetical protein